MTKAERDFFEAAFERIAKALIQLRALLAEEEKHAVGNNEVISDEKERDTSSDTATVASPPVAEPKRGAEECLAFVRSNLLWNYRDGHRNFAEGAILALDEALRLYREERDARK